MPNPSIVVSQPRQLIQLRSNNLSTRYIARALSLRRVRYRSTAARYLSPATCGRRRWRRRRVFAARCLRLAPTTTAPGCAWIQTEMRRHKHVTLQMLWEGYQASCWSQRKTKKSQPSVRVAEPDIASRTKSLDHATALPVLTSSLHQPNLLLNHF